MRETAIASEFIVIHDLRLEHNGRVAQIDHLILFRTLECHVLESKGYGTQIRVTEAGEWEVRTRYGWKGMASPVEQNRRHIEVLKSFIDDHDLAPKRLGISMPLSFHNWVLVSPECLIKRNAREMEKVVKMDLFQSKFKERLDKAGVSWVVSSVAKFVSLETIEAIGKSLIAGHRPATFNVAAKFGITASVPERKPVPTSLVVPQEHQCKNCGVGGESGELLPIELKEIRWPALVPDLSKREWEDGL